MGGMNEYDARLSVLNNVRDTLLDISDAPLDDLDAQDTMGEAADLVLDGIGFTIVATEPGAHMVEVPEGQALVLVRVE